MLRKECTSTENKDINIYMKSYILKEREQKRTLLYSSAEALCVLTGTGLFVPFSDSQKAFDPFKNEITVRQKSGWGKCLFVPNWRILT